MAEELTEFPIAKAFLLHLSLQISHRLQLRLLFPHRVPQMLQFLLLRGRLQLPVLLLLQEMQALLLLRTVRGQVVICIIFPIK